MSIVTQRRILKEIQRLHKDKPTNVSAEPCSENDPFILNAMIIGPNDTPYQGGIFLLRIEFGQEYPLEPPKIVFKTKIYHPNIAPNGQICLDILKGNWSPALSITSVLLSISSLLSDPNPDDPLMLEVARVYRENRDLFNKNARDWTLRYASASSSSSSSSTNPTITSA